MLKKAAESRAEVNMRKAMVFQLPLIFSGRVIVLPVVLSSRVVLELTELLVVEKLTKAPTDC